MFAIAIGRVKLNTALKVRPSTGVGPREGDYGLFLYSTAGQNKKRHLKKTETHK